MVSEVTMSVDGMSCGGCVRNVTGVLEALPGVVEVRVSLEAAQAVVRYDPAAVSVAQMRDAVADAGFDVPV